MHKYYIKSLSNIVQKTKQDIQNYYEENSGEESEDNEVSKSLAKLLKQLEDTKNIINHHLKSPREGYLVLEHISSNYVIKFLNSDTFQPFNCGCYLEAYVTDKGWNVVRIEHNLEKGYYFYNPVIGSPKLYANMKVRVSHDNLKLTDIS